MRKQKPLSQLTPRAAELRGLRRGIDLCERALMLKQAVVDSYRAAWLDCLVLLPPERVKLLRFEGDPPRPKTKDTR